MTLAFKPKRFVVISVFSFLLACTVDLVSDFEATSGLRWLFTLRGSIKPPADVVIVAIDQPSINQYFPNQPIDFTQWRSKHTGLVDQLNKEGVSLIIFDLFLQSPQPDVDPTLAQAFRSQHNVLIGDYCVEASNNTHCRGKIDPNSVQIKSPTPVLADGILDHGPFVLEDNGGEDVINKSLLFIEGLTPPALPVIAWFYRPDVQHYLAKYGSVEPPLSHWLSKLRKICKTNGRLINHPSPQDALGKQINNLLCSGDTRYLNFYGPPGTIRTESYSTVREGKVSDLTSKVVFVGQSLQIRDDMFRTPTTTDESGKMTGVEIMATHYANLLQNNFIEPINASGLGLVMALFALVASFLLNQFPVLPGLAVTVLFCCSYLRLAVSAFAYAGWWMPVAVPLLVELPIILMLSLFWATVDYLKEVQRLKEIIDQITQENNRLIDRFIDRVKESEKLELRLPREDNPQTVYAVCLATDVEGYTTLSEFKGSTEIAGLLKTYYEIFSPIINESGGIIRSIAGDGIIATWDDPAILDKPFVACRAALKIQQVLKESGLNDILPTRFGLHEGEFTLLNIEDWKKNPVGDAINTVSRIEGVNKELKTTVLASTSITQHLPKNQYRSVGWFLLKGKIHPLELAELRTETSTNLFFNDFKRGLQDFRYGEWAKAEQIFASLLQKDKNDGPTEYYLTKSIKYRDSPPPDWQGYIILETK